ncbi:STY0301 family protein [Massilia sp. Root351]|uniref:STY0301 family protein n=1 Tax=Massilia sp. Root351 TaxID=1736522 RepID=UPI000A56631D|nr:STY0301 family protein [Massilia sp. Root351]
MKYMLAISCVLLAAVGNVTQAEKQDIVCPPAILASTTVATADGWEPVGGAAEYKLEHAQLFSGHPSGEVQVRPDESSRDKSVVTQWRLNPAQAPEFWIGCAYRDTTVLLARKLDTRLSRCIARYDRTNGPPPGHLQSLTCS